MGTISRAGGIRYKEETVILKKNIQQLSYNAEGNAEYIGTALPQTATSEPKWQIRKLIYSGSDVIKVLFAEGSSDFNKAWDARTSYSYS